MAIDAPLSIGSTELPEDRRVHPHFRDSDLLESVLRQSGELQDAQGLIVQSNGTRHQDDFMELVQHQGRNPVAAEQRRDCRPYRTVTDDQYIDGGGRQFANFLVVVHLEPLL
ncbi:hypothetical protein D9M71_313050 [compost metagenome]